MSAYCEIPRVFFFLDRTYSYPTLPWVSLHGREVELANLFLHSGGAISGKFVVRVIVSPMHGRIDLLRSGPSANASWVMLTHEEAQILASMMLNASAPTAAAEPLA